MGEADYLLRIIGFLHGADPKADARTVVAGVVTKMLREGRLEIGIDPHRADHLRLIPSVPSTTRAAS